MLSKPSTINLSAALSRCLANLPVGVLLEVLMRDDLFTVVIKSGAEDAFCQFIANKQLVTTHPALAQEIIKKCYRTLPIDKCKNSLIPLIVQSHLLSDFIYDVEEDDLFKLYTQLSPEVLRQIFSNQSAVEAMLQQYNNSGLAHLFNESYRDLWPEMMMAHAALCCVFLKTKQMSDPNFFTDQLVLKIIEFNLVATFFFHLGDKLDVWINLIEPPLVLKLIQSLLNRGVFLDKKLFLTAMNGLNFFYANANNKILFAPVMQQFDTDFLEKLFDEECAKPFLIFVEQFDLLSVVLASQSLSNQLFACMEMKEKERFIQAIPKAAVFESNALIALLNTINSETAQQVSPILLKQIIQHGYFELFLQKLAANAPNYLKQLPLADKKWLMAVAESGGAIRINVGEACYQELMKETQTLLSMLWKVKESHPEIQNSQETQPVAVKKS